MFHFKTGASLLMAGVTAFSCVAPAFASNIWDESFTHNTQEGSDSNVDVNVLVQNRTVPVIFSAYVPATVKIAVSRDKQIITPENLRIINGVDTLPIGVWDVKTKPVNGWTILDWDTNFKDKQLTDQKKFAMTMNGNDLSAAVSKIPWEIQAAGELPLDLDAKITYQSQAKDLEEIMTVSFTMDWMDRVEPLDGKPHATGNELDSEMMNKSAIPGLTGKITFSRKPAPASATIPLNHNGSVLAEIQGQDVTIYSKNGGGVFAPENSGMLFNTFRNENFSIDSWYCGYKMSEIDLSGLDTSRVKNLGGMFYHCENIRAIDMSTFDTRNVVGSIGGMFEYTLSLQSLNLSGFHTENATNASYMFYNCAAPVLDLSSFNLDKVTDTLYMFLSSKARTVYCRSESDLQKMRNSPSCNASGFVVGHPESKAVS